MPVVSVVVNALEDERVLQTLAAQLRSNSQAASQLRDFASTLENDQVPQGLQFQPKPGQIVACHFGLGFRKPENVKTRPVLVVSPHRRDNVKLCIVVPISSTPPNEVRPYHYKLPKGLVPNEKYEEAWLKGDLIVSVACHRLDRFKVGFRQYVAPMVPVEVLREARRCVLHATGMHSLTEHW